MFNRIKRFLSPEPSSPCEIVQCETRALDSAEGPKFVVMLAANLNRADALDTLIEALLERFKVQRMISPPETSLLLITIIGPCRATDAVVRWRARVAGDQIAKVWMDRMEKADLAVGPAKGAVDPAYYSLF